MIRARWLGLFKWVYSILLVLSVLIVANTHAEDPSEKLDFESDVVEGLQKKPLDSFQQISDKNNRGDDHLYEKKWHFIKENNQNIEELRWAK